MNEASIAEVKGPGVIDVTVWQQQRSMTVHLVNLTNPMMMKGPFRELIPVSAEVSIAVPPDKKVTAVRLLISEQKLAYEIKNGKIEVKVPSVMDHEIVGIDFA